MNLVRAEFGRLYARRFVRLMLVLLIAAFGVTIATTLVSTHQPTARELAQAEVLAEQQRQANERIFADCQAAKIGTADSEFPPEFLAKCDLKQPAEVHETDYLYGVFVFEREIRPLTYFLITFLVLFGFLVGASYIGADLNSGGMTNLLLWRPQRMIVLGTKLGTLLAAVLAVALVSAVVYLSAFWVIAQVSGFPGELDGEFWRWLGLTAVRGVTLILLVTALSFGLAVLGRHTAAALGVVAGYAVVWELGARIVMEIVNAFRPDQWMLSTYVGAWMSGKIDLWDSTTCTGFSVCDGRYTITWVPALIVLLVLVGGCVGAAFASFRQRDLA
ncbi:ABC transporter permease subunit [Micromonospora sp. NPDC003197]